MTLLWINLFLIFSLTFFARYFASPVYAGGVVVDTRPVKFLMFAAFLIVTTIAGLRSNIGDTYFYMHSFETSTYTWEFIQSQKDIGFGFLQLLLQNYVSTDPQVLIFTAAMVTYIFVFIVFYQYSRLIELSFFVFITSGWFLVSMNGIRQCLAAAIAFIAIRYIIKGNWVKYFLVIIIASLFHQSALILLPIYFLVRVKAWSKATVGIITVAVIIAVGFEQFSSLLFSAIEDTQYGAYKDFAEGGANILRVLVDAAPLAVAYLGRDRLRDIFPNSDYIVNMALLGLVFMVIATQNWIFARFTIYFSLYQAIIVSWIVLLFRERDRKLIYSGILICYLAYYYYENVISLNIIYESDFLVL
ncbi:EpsG family protein [Sediminibacillus massiliensis]|uniref:EpsG family protein n=1 Tax=Sediminibacillus massiliensis TaxID=1926277 RepID=UPI000988333E|nr:EpsG family protein [Sediminibacillus massiliensis]